MLAAKEIAQLDNVTPTPEQQAQAKQALEQNGVLQQLDNSPLVQANPTLKSEYLNLYATQLAYASPEHANKAHRAEFDSLIKGIENDLNLPDSSHLTYDTKKLVENRTNFFDEKRGNESLRKERDQNL
ncbi:MAG: hypothetical protein LBG59_07770 [Candidatus Peribacteria bacterium]|jgi:hypothetical protein|nr:hypothetical protein [Candidatus Peribacteria bacterium]